MNRTPNGLVVLAAAFWLQPPAALADNNEDSELALVYGDKASVSIATGSQQPLRRAPAIASVITAEDIAAMGATDLDEVLETVPGIHVTHGSSVYTPQYMVRGIYSQFTPQTLVLQNGIPITTMFQGTKGGVWGGYPLEHIARIEIIRGPGSALYGADAYSGVINIITKTEADTRGTQLGLRTASFNTWDAWAQHGGRVGSLEIAAYLRAGHTDGFQKTMDADAQTRNDSLFGTKASLAPGPVNVGRDAVDVNLDLAYDKWRFRAGYKLRDNVGTGAGVAGALDPVGKARSERITTDISWTHPQFTPDVGLGLTASYLHYADTIVSALQLLPPGTRLPTGSFPDGMIGAPEKWERQFRVSGFATYTGVRDHSMRMGVGHDDLNLYQTREQKNFSFNAAGTPVPIGAVVDYTTIAPFLLPQLRKVDYYYLQDEWNFAKDWATTVGVRRDNYSDFGGTTNPRVSLVWDAAYNLTTKLLYGQAFRAPSFTEQASINNPVARGNPNLLPETIRTVEAALAWTASPDTQVNLSIFNYVMNDIIRAVPNSIPGTGSTFNNIGSQNGRGLELEIVWDPSRNVRLSGNYAWQRSIDESSNQDAGYAPHHHLYTRLDWQFARGWLFSTQLNAVADRQRAFGDARPAIPNYTTVDLTLRSNRGKNQWDFAGTIRNLFNAEVLEPSLSPGLAIPNDVPMAPRSVSVQASYRF